MPAPELDERFGDATEPVTWEQVEAVLREAEVFWITTTKADGQPHLTPLLAPYADGALHFCTGAREQKAKNLEHSPKVTMLTAEGNRFAQGFDVVVEGEAVRISDVDRLRTLAEVWVAQYGDDWRFDVQGDTFHSDEGGPALVYRVEASKVLAFTRGTFGQTRFRF